MCKPVNRVQLVELVLGKVRRSGPGGRISTGHERERGDCTRVHAETGGGWVESRGWGGCAKGGKGGQRLGRVGRGWAGNGRGKASALKTKLKLRWAG